MSSQVVLGPCPLKSVRAHVEMNQSIPIWSWVGPGPIPSRVGPNRYWAELVQAHIEPSLVEPMSSPIETGRCWPKLVRADASRVRQGPYRSKSPQADVKSSGCWPISGRVGVGWHQLEPMWSWVGLGPCRADSDRSDIEPSVPEPMSSQAGPRWYQTERAWVDVEASQHGPLSSGVNLS